MVYNGDGPRASLVLAALQVQLVHFQLDLVPRTRAPRRLVSEQAAAGRENKHGRGTAGG